MKKRKSFCNNNFRWAQAGEKKKDQRAGAISVQSARTALLLGTDPLNYAEIAGSF